MKKEIKKFLEFNGTNIYFLAVGGVYWIAIKPICEALNVDYIRQFKNLKEDKILGQLLSEQTMVGKDNKQRNMICLSEFFVYGWIFSIQSESEELQTYKWKCYELLYNHFHGTITERQNFLKIKTKADVEIEKLEEELQNSDAFKRIIELKKNKRTASCELVKLDRKIIKEQYDLWLQEI